MCINRFTKIVFGIAIVITAQPFFGIILPKPKGCAAASAWLIEREKKEKLEQEFINACKEGKFDEVKQLINVHKVNINARNPHGQTALMAAASYGHLDIVRYLVDECGANINLRDYDGETALMSVDNLEVVKFLIARKININARDNHGQTALMSHASMGIFEIVKCLVEHGADIKASDDTGNTALDKAKQCEDYTKEHGHPPFKDFTKEYGAYGIIIDYLSEKLAQKPVLYALHLCNASLKTEGCPFPRELIDRVLIKVIAAVPATPACVLNQLLVEAVCAKKLEAARSLIAQDADVNITFFNGLGKSCRSTLLHQAIENHDLAMVRLLIESNADIEGRDFMLRTPLMCAAATGNIKIATLLLQNSANINAREEENCTALHWAARDALDMIELLVQNGIDIYATDFKGATAFDHAQCTHRGSPVVDYLAYQMAARPTLHALLACDELIKEKPDTVPHDHFPPEDIGRILRPCIAAALSGK